MSPLHVMAATHTVHKKETARRPMLGPPLPKAEINHFISQCLELGQGILPNLPR